MSLPAVPEEPRLPALHPANPATPMRAAVLGALWAGGLAAVPALLGWLKLWTLSIAPVLVLFGAIGFTQMLRDAENRTLQTGSGMPLSFAYGVLGAVSGAVFNGVMGMVWITSSGWWWRRAGDPSWVMRELAEALGYAPVGLLVGAALGMGFGWGVARDRLQSRRPLVALARGSLGALVATVPAAILLFLGAWAFSPYIHAWEVLRRTLLIPIVSQAVPLLFMGILPVLLGGSLPFLLGTVDPRLYAPLPLPERKGER